MVQIGLAMLMSALSLLRKASHLDKLVSLQLSHLSRIKAY